jgi:hypothetical protein
MDTEVWARKLRLHFAISEFFRFPGWRTVMPEHIEDYRGIEIRRRSNSEGSGVEDYYGTASGRVLASDNTIEGLKRKIDQLLDQSRK